MIRSVLAAAAAALVVGAALPASASATDDVRAALRKFAALQSVEMVTQVQGKTATIDMINHPAAMHMSGGGMEMISLGDTSYMKMGGSWRKFTSSHGRNPMADPLRHFADKANDVTAGDLGMKTIGGGVYHAYRVTSKGSNDSGVVYVGLDGLPHRFEGSDHTVVQLTKFNSVPPIRAPI